MVGERPWYYDYVIKYGVRNENGEIVKLSDAAPPDVQKAFKKDRAEEVRTKKEFCRKGYCIS